MLKKNLHPLSIDPHGNSEMAIVWSNQERFLVPYFGLRCHCPCAGCVDEHTGERTLQPKKIRPDVKPTDIHQVGNYAITITWSDGHSTGIYHYDRLFQLCKLFKSLDESEKNE